MQHVVADLFSLNGMEYLAYACRLTGWVEVGFFDSTPSSLSLEKTLREFFHRWGCPEQISVDGGSNLNSSSFSEFLNRWGVQKRQSSAYYPQSNGRAEDAVKTIKRLIRCNTSRSGGIHTDDVAMALLQHRNTLLRDVGKSPAELALCRSLRDGIPLLKQRYRIHPHWSSHISQRETQIVKKMKIVKEKYDHHASSLTPLPIGSKVLCQNTRTLNWDKAGSIVEVKPHIQYIVKMEGSNRLSLRNRQHLQ